MVGVGVDVRGGSEKRSLSFRMMKNIVKCK